MQERWCSTTEKPIPSSYINGRFVCRDDESKEFDVRKEMLQDLDLYWHFEDVMTTQPSKGENFPIPDINNAHGELYLRCDRGINQERIFLCDNAGFLRSYELIKLLIQRIQPG